MKTGNRTLRIKRCLIALAVIAIGVLGSMPFLRPQIWSRRGVRPPEEAALPWRDRATPLLDVAGKQRSLPAPDQDRRPFWPRPKQNDSKQPNRPGSTPPRQAPGVPDLPGTYHPFSISGEADSTAADRREPLRHTIVDGDTLENLAAKYLGDPKRADEIFQANRRQLSDRHALPLGVEIEIPGDRPTATDDGAAP